MRRFLILTVLVLLLATCGNGEKIGNPTAGDILTSNPDADIFQYNGIVYSNVSHLDHYEIEDYDKGYVIGVIDDTSDNPRDFGDFTASILPSGTPLYSTTKEETDLHSTIIATVNEEEFLYIAMLEG